MYVCMYCILYYYKCMIKTNVHISWLLTKVYFISKQIIQHTSCPPANNDHLVEFECKQILCSPGVCEVNVNLPSAEKYLDIITFSLGSFTSTCMPIPGLEGKKSFMVSS